MDIKTATNILRKKYKNARATKVNQIKGGNISKAFVILSENPKKDLVLKVYPDNFHWKMEKEIYCYKLIERKVLTPKILIADDSKKLIKQNYILMTKIEGEMLKGKTFTAKEKEILFEQMGNALKKIHSLRMPAYGYIGTKILHPHKTNYEYMTHQFSKKVNEFLELGGKKNIADRIVKYVEKNKKFLKNCQSPRLCHNDYHGGNVLAVGTKMTGIIDVENMLSGDPLMDIAKMRYYDVKGDKAKEKGFMKGYGTLPKDAEQRIQMYTLYFALELWDWFASIGKKEHLENIHKDIINFSI